MADEGDEAGLDEEDLCGEEPGKQDGREPEADAGSFVPECEDDPDCGDGAGGGAEDYEEF